MKTMTSKGLLAFLVFALTLTALAVNVSAFGDITDVEVSGVDTLNGVNIANFAGDRVPVLVVFNATADASDVRVKIWVSGERENAVVSEEFDVIAGKTYPRTVWFDVPTDLDQDLDQARSLEIVVESKEAGTADVVSIDFTVQRETYDLSILSAVMEPTVNAGDTLAVDVVLKNEGRHFAEDSFLVVRIPELGLETKIYFGDLSAQDQSNPDKEDAVERRAYLRVPSSAQTGVYTVQLEASNDDSIATAERRVFVTGESESTQVIASSTSKNLGVNEAGKYTLTFVNAGNEIKVYELTVNAGENLNVDVSDPVVVVPAGSSRTVTMDASSAAEGKYTFTVDVRSGTELITSKTFTANVEGSSKNLTAGNATVLLTVVLAIVFVVLLVVLIVLLTRKPEKSEEFSESYY